MTPPRHRATSPLLRAVVGASLISFSGIWVALAGVPAASSAFFRCAYALPALAWLARRERRRGVAPTTRQTRMGHVAGVCFVVDLVLWHTSIEMIGAGLATVLAASQVVIVPLVAWSLLAERPSRRTLQALPALVLGVVVVSGALGGAAYGSRPALGTVLGAGAGIAYSGFLLALRQATAGGLRPAGALRDATAVAMAGSAVIAVVGGHSASLVPAWPSAGWLLALGLGSQVVAWLLITGSLGRLPAAVSSVVLTVQPVASLALGVLLLGERPAPVQVGGAVLVVLAVTYATGLGHRSPVPAPPRAALPDVVCASCGPAPGAGPS